MRPRDTNPATIRAFLISTGITTAPIFDALTEEQRNNFSWCAACALAVGKVDFNAVKALTPEISWRFDDFQKAPIVSGKVSFAQIRDMSDDQYEIYRKCRWALNYGLGFDELIALPPEKIKNLAHMQSVYAIGAHHKDASRGASLDQIFNMTAEQREKLNASVIPLLISGLYTFDEIMSRPVAAELGFEEHMNFQQKCLSRGVPALEAFSRKIVGSVISRAEVESLLWPTQAHDEEQSAGSGPRP